jgi:multicomponent Na+:H+ antiporter subunit D
MLTVEQIPLYTLLFLFLAALAVFYLTRYRRSWGENSALVVCSAPFFLVVGMAPSILQGEILTSSYKVFSLPFSITFRVDIFSFFMALIITFLWMLAAFYSRGYLAHGHAHARYYSFLVVVLAGTLGAVLAGDLIGFLLFFEIMAVASYVLIVHEEDPAAMFAGAKYLYLAVAAGLAVFLGILITYFMAGDLSLGRGPLITEGSLLALMAFIAFIVGMGIKAGMFPLHVWLPDAHPAAPAPVSALLSGVMIKLGAYGLIRVFYDVFSLEFLRARGWNKITLVLAVITILLGSALALRQDDLKRRLAYSSIAQIGYVLLGLSLLTERALAGAVFHIFTHAFMKGCLFMCAGAIIVQTGKRKISELKGIGLQMPLTMICFTMAALSMVGIPPFNGFVSKWEISMGALDIGQPLYVFLLILSSLLNAAYYFPIVVAAFFAVPDKEKRKSREAPVIMVAPMVILALGTFIFALLPQHWPLRLAQAVAQGISAGF